MEIHLNPEQEAQLSQIATHSGKDPEQLVMEAALRLIDEDAAFRAAVRKGIAQADRGQLLSEDEMEVRLQRMFQS
jgi:predicted transcriptional regulator